MTYRPDPEGNEIKALHAAVNFDGAHVLEVGAGDGRMLFRYASDTAHTVGFDPGSAYLAQAAENCPADLRDKVAFLQCRAEELPLKSQKFDTAIFGWSL